MTSDRPTSPYVLIQSSECISLNNNRSVATIAAIAKDEIKPNDLVNVRSGEAYDKLPDGMRWRADQDFTFLQNTNLQKSLIKAPTIKSPREMPFVYEGKEIEDSFQIQSIAPNGMQLSLVSRSPQMLNWIIFPLIGVAILGWIIWRRKKQTGSST